MAPLNVGDERGRQAVGQGRRCLRVRGEEPREESAVPGLPVISSSSRSRPVTPQPASTDTASPS